MRILAVLVLVSSLITWCGCLAADTNGGLKLDREKIDGTAALRSRNVATIRNFAQMVIGSLLALFLRRPKNILPWCQACIIRIHG